MDGYSIPLKFEPINFDPNNKVAKGTTISAEFKCTAAMINEFDSNQNCPDILKIKGAGQDLDIIYCMSICNC